MEKLNRDELFSLLGHMEIYTFLKFSETCKKYYKMCNGDYIWYYKLKNEFPNFEENKILNLSGKNLTPKEKYKNIYLYLQSEINILNLNMDIYMFYDLINVRLVSQKEFMNIILKIINISETIRISRDKLPYLHLLYSWILKNLYILNKYERFKISCKNKLNDIIVEFDFLPDNFIEDFQDILSI